MGPQGTECSERAHWASSVPGPAPASPGGWLGDGPRWAVDAAAPAELEQSLEIEAGSGRASRGRASLLPRRLAAIQGSGSEMG